MANEHVRPLSANAPPHKKPLRRVREIVWNVVNENIAARARVREVRGFGNTGTTILISPDITANGTNTTWKHLRTIRSKNADGKTFIWFVA